MTTPSLGFGLGLRPPHYAEVLQGAPRAAWFEVISENFLGLAGASAGRPIKTLERLRERFPIAMHGVSMSLGSADPLDLEYLRRLKALFDRIQPAWISDHLCWTGIDRENLHDLLPLPYTREAVEHAAARIRQAQDFLGRRLLIENVSSYAEFADPEMTEWEFLSEVAERADCGILLDVNNVFVSGFNHGFDPRRYLEGIDPRRVGQMHLAGHSHQGTHLIDTHDAPVPEGVWDLYRAAIDRFGVGNTMIEWDAKIPAYAELEAQLDRAREIARERGHA